MSTDEFKAYYSSNKECFVKERDTDLLKFKAEYVPSDILCLHETPYVNDEELRKKRLNYDSAVYFKFYIKASDNSISIRKLIQNKENLARLNNYLMTDIIKDFHLQIGNEEVKCSIINVESDLMIQSNIVFLMSFEKPKGKINLTEDLTLIYDDNIFQNGAIKFKFDINPINNYPKIKTV